MQQTLIAFTLAFMAGISTCLGALFVLKIKKKSNKIIIASLAFASGVMFFLSITDLTKEAFLYLNEELFAFPSVLILLIFLVVGIIISWLIDRKFPNDVLTLKKEKNLYKVGIISMIAIIVHNIPEGIATFMTASDNLRLGISLALAITMHNIPEGISIAMPLYYATNDKKKAFLYTLLSGGSEFLGSIMAFLFLAPLMSPIFMGILFSLIAGIMIHISMYELLPTSLKYHNYKLTIIFFLIGALFVLFNIIIF